MNPLNPAADFEPQPALLLHAWPAKVQNALPRSGGYWVKHEDIWRLSPTDPKWKFFWIRIHFCIGTCAAVAKCRKFRCASDRNPQGPLGPFLLRYPSSVSSGNWSIGITWPQGLAQSFHSATTGIPRCVQGEWPGWCCVATGHKPPKISKIRRMFTVWCVMRVAFLHTLQFGHSSGGEALKDVVWTVPVFFLTKNSKTWAR